MNNPLAALSTIIASARSHPWLLALLVVAIIAHGADLQWPAYHKFLSTVAYGVFAISFLYASGTALPPKEPNPPANPAQPKQETPL